MAWKIRIVSKVTVILVTLGFLRFNSQGNPYFFKNKKGGEDNEHRHRIELVKNSGNKKASNKKT